MFEQNFNYDKPNPYLILSNITFFQLRGLNDTALWLSSLLPIDPIKPTSENFRIYQATIDVDYPGAFQLLIQAKILFESKQYKNCAKIFEDIYDEQLNKILSRSPYAVFIKSYSNFLSHKVANSEEKNSLINLNPLSITSNYVNYLSSIITDIFSSNCELDSPLYWLLGLLCKEIYKINDARCFYLEAIKCNPLNGGAWSDLINLISPEKLLNLHTHTHTFTDNEDSNFESEKERNDLLNNPLYKKFIEDNSFEYLDFTTYEQFITHLKLPNTWTSEIGYALYCVKTFRYIEAVYLYEQILEKHLWHCPNIYAQLAKCGFELNRFDFSSKMFKKLHVIKPLRLDYVEDYATLLCSQGKFEEISRLAHMCYEISPTLPSTCVVIGKYCSSLSEVQQSIFWFEKALQNDRFYLPGLICLANEYLKQNQIDVAVEMFYKANQIDTHNTEVYSGLGQALLIKNDYHLSLYYLEMACLYRPDKYNYWELLGDVQIALGMLEQAIQSYQQSWIRGRQLESLCKIFHFLKKLLKNKNIGDIHSLAQWAQLLFESYVDNEHSKMNKNGQSNYRKNILNDENQIEQIIRFGPNELREAISYLMTYNERVNDKTKAAKFAKLVRATENSGLETAKAILSASK